MEARHDPDASGSPVSRPLDFAEVRAIQRRNGCLQERRIGVDLSAALPRSNDRGKSRNVVQTYAGSDGFDQFDQESLNIFLGQESHPREDVGKRQQ